MFPKQTFCLLKIISLNNYIINFPLISYRYVLNYFKNDYAEAPLTISPLFTLDRRFLDLVYMYIHQPSR